eukprot:snap_masked-scaffold_1-processed-gene-12.21-mRNA-1 protein AED:0.03 eAED:0.03 QI:0/-1/0/1/-1/1/1/0/340
MNKEIKIGINGFGRIGRLCCRIAVSNPNISIVAINDPAMTAEHMAYLFKYDTNYGPFKGTVEVIDSELIINNHSVKCYQKSSPSEFSWADTETDIVLECSGVFKGREAAEQHIKSGAKKVVLSAPPKDDIPMLVIGVNHKEYDPRDKIVSNASCTTNCLAPLAKLLQDNFGVEEALMGVVHALTQTQIPVDGPAKGGKDWRRGRAAAQNIIPTTTGSAKAVAKVIPSLHGKITGIAFRVPVHTVGVVDLTVKLSRETNMEEIKECVRDASLGDMKGIIGYTEQPVVSSDFVGDARSSIFDATACVMLNPTFFKLVCWSDNEWAYASRVVELGEFIASQGL